jgi:type VI secretion system secreted protein VgrG
VQESPVFRGSYELLSSDRPFRMLPTTPKPRIYGNQTAKVVRRKGEESEEISTDENAHIWVQFFWDREPQISCPVRIAQSWAGRKWGEIFIPRVGMEVVVEFVEGDPDRPLVTGCVYNGDNEPPYTLPANKTQSGWKSESSKGDHGYNEIMLEDKKGSEQIRVHAQLDLNTIVNNNETRSTGNDLDTTVTHAETRTIGEKFEVPVGSASRQTTIKMGDDKLDVDSGNILHTAALKIELKVGPSTFTIEPWGITLDAPMITLQATGPITINGLPVLIN